MCHQQLLMWLLRVWRKLTVRVPPHWPRKFQWHVNVNIYIQFVTCFPTKFGILISLSINVDWHASFLNAYIQIIETVIYIFGTPCILRCKNPGSIFPRFLMYNLLDIKLEPILYVLVFFLFVQDSLQFPPSRLFKFPGGGGGGGGYITSERH